MKLRKKVTVFCCIVGLLVADKVFGLELRETTINQLVVAACAFLIGQGIADFGKEKSSQ